VEQTEVRQPVNETQFIFPGPHDDRLLAIKGILALPPRFVGICTIEREENANLQKVSFKKKQKVQQTKFRDRPHSRHHL
jgi:hypothetical protein